MSRSFPSVLLLVLGLTLAASCDQTGDASSADAAQNGAGEVSVIPQSLEIEEITGHIGHGGVTIRNGTPSTITVFEIVVVTADGTERPADPTNFHAFDGFNLDPSSVPTLPFQLETGTEVSVRLSFSAVKAGRTEATLVVRTHEQDGGEQIAFLFGTAIRCRPWARALTCTWAEAEGAAECVFGDTICQVLCGVDGAAADCFRVASDGSAVLSRSGETCSEPVPGQVSNVLCGELGAPDCPPDEFACDQAGEEQIPR